MKLSSCKHCGSPAHLIKNVTDPHLCWSVQCSNLDCGISTRAFSQQQHAVDVWQRTSYSHRNGETTPPTVPGRYWFDGTTINRLSPSPSVLKGTTRVIGDHGELLAWMDLWDGGQYEPIEQFTGAWWGPVVTPWEPAE